LAVPFGLVDDGGEDSAPRCAHSLLGLRVGVTLIVGAGGASTVSDVSPQVEVAAY
jgi:hypothetical protein